MLKQLKLGVLRLARGVGAFSAFRETTWRNQRLMILCYHGISFEDEHRWSPSLYLSPETFRGRLKLLHDLRYTVLPLGEGLARLWAGTLPRRSVVITFDDGDYNFQAVALPILREFGFPTTVYASTYYSLNQLPVFDVTASYLLWKGLGKTLDTRGLLPDGGDVTLTTDSIRSVFQQVRHAAAQQQLSAIDKDHLAAELARRVGYDYAHLNRRRIFHLMTPEELASISRENVAIELHTHRHRTPREPELFVRELRENYAAIVEATGIPPKHFCYPSGDYSSGYFPLLQSNGIVSATTCEFGLASATDNPMLLPRLLDMESLTALEVEGWLSGFSSVLPHR